MTNLGNSAASRDIAYHVHGYTNLRKHEETGPQIITRGSGIYVYDDNDKPYIEGLAGLWCASLGFGEERLVEAAAAEMRRLPYYHGFASKTTNVTIDLAERLVTMAPVKMSKALFANSGSEATDLAVKLIWYYHNAIGKPEKKKIISRIKGYHGVTVCSASLTGLPHLHNAFDLPIDRILHTDCPHHYRFGKSGESEEDFATRCAVNLEQMILDEEPETIAAFFAEPVMGAGGVIVPPATYYEKVQAVLKKYDILLLADEVICGFGRTGNMWGSQTMDMRPDMITCAKALSASYLPISALMITDAIYQAIADQSAELGIFGHGGTYAGHPVAAAVAMETLKIYDERNIVDHVRQMAPKMQHGLRILTDHPLVGEVRGIGLFAAVELTKIKADKTPFDPNSGVTAHLQERAYQNGLIIRALGDSLALCPPLIIEEKEIEEMLRIFETSLEETHTWVKENNPA